MSDSIVHDFRGKGHGHFLAVMTLGRNDKTLMPNKLPCGLVDNDLIEIAYVELSPDGRG